MTTRDEARLHDEVGGAWALADAQQGRHVLGSVYSLARGGGPKYKGYRPSRGILKYYEGRQRRDIGSLYEGRPYESPELGFSPQEMEARFGARTDEMQAARRGELQSVQGRFRAGTAAGMTTGAYHRGLQRVEQGHLGRVSEVRRRNVLEDALQRRRDWMARHGLVSGAYGQGTGIFGDYAEAAYEAALRRHQGQVTALNDISSYIGAAGGGGGAGISSVFRRHMA